MSTRFVMLRCLLLVAIVAYFSRTIFASPNENLSRVLEKTRHFFEKLKLDYESLPPDSQLYKLIDERIDRYVSEVKKSTKLSRGKRQLDRDKDVRILSGFERVPDLDLSNVIDVTFFVYRGDGAPRWYAAALNSTGITLLRYQSRSFELVEFLELEYGDRIVSQSSDAATLLVVQCTSLGGTPVVRLNLDTANAGKVLRKVQTIDAPEVECTAIWQGMRKIYLAVASRRDRISVYLWLGKHFDRVQILTSIGTSRIVPFRTSGAMHLMTIGSRRAAIVKFLASTRQFVVVQTFEGHFADGISFDLEKRHDGEYFVMLAGENSSVLYKQSRHRFVPFQEIAGARKIAAFHDRAAILLFLLRTNGSLGIFQYDGWKFVEMTGLRDNDAVYSDARSIRLGDETFSIYQEIAEATELAPYWKNGEFSGNRTWSFRRMLWERKEETWSSWRERTGRWCRDATNTIAPLPDILPSLQVPVILERGRIGTLRAREVNGRSPEEFANFRKDLDAIVTEAKSQEEALKHYVSRNDPLIKNLRARDLRLNCTRLCRAANVTTRLRDDFLERIRWLDDKDQNYNFLSVKISHAHNLPCPYPAPKFQDIETRGLVNGVPFVQFTEDLVKVRGDQVFTGSPEFNELRVRDARVPLDVASNFTRQEIIAVNVRANDLNVTTGHFLLSLMSESRAAMSGSLAIRRVRVRGLFDSRGKIDGPGKLQLSPVIEIDEDLDLVGNFSLADANIRGQLRVGDLERANGRSYNYIISKALPLDAERVPVRFRFRSDRVSWGNVTVSNLPYKWLTKEHSGHVVITGHKNATQPILTLENSTYKDLPIYRLPLRLCGPAAMSEGVWESNLSIDRGIALSVTATNLFEGSELYRVYADTATSTDEVPWDLKNFTGRVVVGNASIDRLEGVDYHGLKNSLARWIEPGRLNGPVRFTSLKLDELVTTGKLDVPLPSELRNVEALANLNVRTLNGVDVDEFMTNAVKLNDTLSLTNFTFAGGLVADEILASRSSFGLRRGTATSGEIRLGSKEITGTLECDEIVVANFTDFPPSDRPVDIVINGNVRFAREPKILNLNGENIETVFDAVWLTDRPTKVKANFLEFKNVTFENDLTILKSIETPNLGPWIDLEKRLLSKTRDQTINFPSRFKRLAAPGILAKPKSRLRANVSYIRDLEYSSLKNNEPQAVTNDWTFDELIVTGNYDFRGRINGLDLSSDVVRTDTRKNVVMGKKIFRSLSAHNVDGLRFGKFARKALLRSSGTREANETIVVKGWKTFDSVEMGDLRVEGTLSGRRIERALSKTSDQELRGTKLFRGFVATPAIVNDGLVNGIKLRSFVEQQLKKRDSRAQIIKTPILLCNNVTIFGNVTIRGLYNGVELSDNLGNVNDTLLPVAARSRQLLDYGEGIVLALANRATYWDKLEFIDESAAATLIPEIPKTEFVHFDDPDLGDCGVVNLTLQCNGRRFWQYSPSGISAGSHAIEAKLIDDSGRPILVFVAADPDGGVLVMRYDPLEKKFYEAAGLRVPEVLSASIGTTGDSIWIGLRVRDRSTLALRYETWSNRFERWSLAPDGEANVLVSATPNGELLMLRTDGVWKLGGLGEPRHIFPANLPGVLSAFEHGHDHYVRLENDNCTIILKSRYIGN